MATTAIITGASSGIGMSFVKALLKESTCPDKIWIVARRLDRLEELAKLSDKLIPVKADLLKEEGIDTIKNKLNEEHPEVVLLVNCAGMGKKGDIADRPSKDISDAITLNCTALSVLTREVIPFMPEDSRIINVGSSAAYLPQPHFTVYAASKSYVVSFSRALARELRKKRIYVTVVCPGPVETEFNKLATDGASAEFTGFRKFVAADADKLAAASLKAARHKRVMFVYGLPNKALHVAAKLMPVGLYLKLFYR
ncbi:MAG: SDR family NAD(P)-dependent oxidoreductase [Clostridiales bacterium]|nr:SDR family NAD(P)-dependent oxidoreductase [Clostridiales bacterium]